jgi:Amidohydrolase ring-opening protein (Amido_AtzD_TrzD)
MSTPVSCTNGHGPDGRRKSKRLAIGIAATRDFLPHEIGRAAQIEATAQAVRQAIDGSAFASTLTMRDASTAADGGAGVAGGGDVGVVEHGVTPSPQQAVRRSIGGGNPGTAERRDHRSGASCALPRTMTMLFFSSIPAEAEATPEASDQSDRTVSSDTGAAISPMATPTLSAEAPRE